jgi:hypothetical protein
MKPQSDLAALPIDETILARIGRVTTEWGWIERLMGELLAYMCKADASRMYVITQGVSNAAVSGWLSTLAPMVFQRDPERLRIVVELLKEVDLARNERNEVIHGSWRGSSSPGFAHVVTTNWDRKEVFKDAMWSVSDLEQLIGDINGLIYRLYDFCSEIGAIRTIKTAPLG